MWSLFSLFSTPQSSKDNFPFIPTLGTHTANQLSPGGKGAAVRSAGEEGEMEEANCFWSGTLCSLSQKKTALLGT